MPTVVVAVVVGEEVEAPAAVVLVIARLTVIEMPEAQRVVKEVAAEEEERLLVVPRQRFEVPEEALVQHCVMKKAAVAQMAGVGKLVVMKGIVVFVAFFVAVVVVVAAAVDVPEVKQTTLEDFVPFQLSDSEVFPR